MEVFNFNGEVLIKTRIKFHASKLFFFFFCTIGSALTGHSHASKLLIMYLQFFFKKKYSNILNDNLRIYILIYQLD